jgi:hypothetical protein
MHSHRRAGAHSAAHSIPSLWRHVLTRNDTLPKVRPEVWNRHSHTTFEKYAQLDSPCRETQYPLPTRITGLAIFGVVVSVPLGAIALSDAEEADQHHASTRSPGRIVPSQGSARPLHVPATAPLDGDA